MLIHTCYILLSEQATVAHQRRFLGPHRFQVSVEAKQRLQLIPLATRLGRAFDLLDIPSSKEQATTIQEEPSSSSTPGRITNKVFEGFTIPHYSTSSNQPKLCLSIDAKNENQTMFNTTSAISQTLGDPVSGSTTSVAPTTMMDVDGPSIITTNNNASTDSWALDFLSAVQGDPGFGQSAAVAAAAAMTEPCDATWNNDFELNTPTSDYTHSELIAQLASVSQTSMTDNLPEIDISGLINAPTVEDVWLLDSPASPNDLLAVPPRMVEGISESTPYQTAYHTSEPIANTIVDMPPNNFIDENSIATTSNRQLSTAVGSQEHQQPMSMANETENDQEEPKNDLLNWLINDTISHQSQMPGEEVIKEEMVDILNKPLQLPEYPSTIDYSQLFDDYKLTASSSSNNTNVDNTSSKLMYVSTTTSNSNNRLRHLSTSSSLSSTSTVTSHQQPPPSAAQPTPVKTRGRGRPPKPLGRAITPAVRRGRVVSDTENSTDGNLTEAEISDQRYRRMRDLNNEASKRCRENRKRKQEVLEEECEQLKERNTHLKAKLRKLESAVAKLKSCVLTNVGGGGGTSVGSVAGSSGEQAAMEQMWSL